MSGSFANGLFNATYYLQNNPDVVAAIAKGQFTSALDHFTRFGQYELRNPTVSFNAQQYLINNADVAAAVGAKQLASAWTHFVTFGVTEGRSAGFFTGTFNEAAYLAANPDVAAAVKAGSFVSGYAHYLLFGQNEGRSAVTTTGVQITPAVSGSTFTLTTGVDNLVGAATGNNTFNAFSAAGAQAATDTLTAADIIQGKGSNNVFSLTNTAATLDATAGAQISGIQTFNIRNTAATLTSTALDASKIAGLTAVNSNLGTGDVAVSNLASGASAGIIGNGTVANGTLTAGYVAAATAATLNLSGGVTTAGMVTINGAGITSTAVNSIGVANKLTGGLTLAATDTSLSINAASNLTIGAITAAALTGITVSGIAANVNFGVAPAAVKTIDASGLTAGGVTVTTGATLTAFTGGAGANTLTLGAAPTAAATVKFGAGNDRLFGTTAVANTFSADGGTGSNTLSTGLLNAGNASKFTNFQTLSLQSTAALDVSLVAGVTALSIDVANVNNTYSNVTVAQGLTDTFVGDNTGATNTLNFTGLTGTANAYTNTFAGAAQTTVPTAANVKEGTLVLTGINNVNIVSGGGANTWNSVVLGTDAAANTVAITGAQNLDLTFVGFGNIVANTPGNTGVTLINGSAATGRLNINEANVTGATAGIAVRGGTGNDTITTSNFASTVTGGGGADTFVIGATTAGANVSSSTSFTTITDAIVGSKITFLAPVVGLDQGFTTTAVNIGAAATLSAALDIAANAANTGLTVGQTRENFFVFGANTYVLQHVQNNTAGVSSADVFAKLNPTSLTTALGYNTTTSTLTVG